MDSSFEAIFNLRNKEGDYNLLAELQIFLPQTAYILTAF